MVYGRINKGLIALFLPIGVLIVSAGFLVGPDPPESGDGIPINAFLWITGGSWIAGNLLVLLVAVLIDSVRDWKLSTWYPGTAEILEASGTGSFVRGDPGMEFQLRVTSDIYGIRKIRHREVIPREKTARFAPGTTHQVRVNPDDPEQVIFVHYHLPGLSG